MDRVGKIVRVALGLGFESKEISVLQMGLRATVLHGSAGEHMDPARGLCLSDANGLPILVGDDWMKREPRTFPQHEACVYKRWITPRSMISSMDGKARSAISGMSPPACADTLAAGDLPG